MGDNNNSFTTIRMLIDGMLDNCERPDVDYGIIIASPSREDPDYYYEWVRDSGIVVNMILDCVESNTLDFSRISNLIKNYCYNHKHFQNICLTDKGAQKYLDNGIVLSNGEPKFNIDNTPYNENWGRPQNDGPALRSIALCRFANMLLEDEDQENHKENYNYVVKNIYDSHWPNTHSVVKRDLEYICEEYNSECFDLWEEITGFHFYTMMVQRKALELGSDLALILGDEGASAHYKEVADKLKDKISELFYVNDEIVSTVTLRNNYYHDNAHNSVHVLRKYDSSVLLAFLHTGYSFNTPLANTICKLAKGFRDEYDVNCDADTDPDCGNKAVSSKMFPNLLMGRYFNDMYYGGNPWVLTTAALCTYLLNVNLESLNTDKLHGDFFELFGKTQEDIKLMGISLFDHLLHIESLNDTYNKERDTNFSFAEQIDREDKSYLSADRLTWNYVELLRVIM